MNARTKETDCRPGIETGDHPVIEIATGGGTWHVLHVKSRQEKAMAEDLRAMGIGFYLPLVSQARYYGRRKMYTEMPLFPGYVFLQGTLDEAYRADREATSGRQTTRTCS